MPAPTSSHAEPTIEERLTAWHDWLADRQRPVTIVVDALDEAANPHTLVHEVLARLEPDPGRPRIRLLAGVRSLAAGEEPATFPGPGSLADLTETALHARRIRADEAPWWDQGDVVAYVDSILRNTPGSPYRNAGAATAAEVAAALGSRAGRSFLIARIAASSLAARETVIAADDPGWLSALDHGVLGVFRQDLHHSLTDARRRRTAVILLRAVAFAYGAGLPWRHIWPLVAHAVDDEGGYYGDDQIADLLGSRLGAYLVTDTEDGVTVYRLFHDLLRSTLRDRWRELAATSAGNERGQTPADPTDPVTGADVVMVEARIARELTRLADVPVTVDCDRPPPPYVRRHLAEHAAAGGVLDDRTIPEAFLPYLDPVRLRAAAARPPSTLSLRPHLPQLPTIRQVTHEWQWDRPAHNATVLALRVALRGRPFDQPIGGAWQVRWAVAFQEDPSCETLVRNVDMVFGLATAVFPDGRVVAVTGSSDKTVRVWDLVTGTPVGQPLTGHTDSLWAVATAVLPDGRLVAVTGSSDRTARVWDLVAGTSVGQPLTGHTDDVRAVATGVLPDGRLVAVTGSHDKTVRVWDLATGTPVGQPLPGHTSYVPAVATAVLPDGRAVAVTGSSDETVRVWDLATGTPVGQPLAGHTDDVRAVATAVLPDGRAVAVTGSSDKTVRVWDLATGTPVGQPLAGHTSGAIAVATAELPDGRAVAVTGSSDQTVRVWDLVSGSTVRRPLWGTLAEVRAVATAVLPDGRAVAVTGSHDTTVRVWDLATGALVGQPLTGHTTPVCAVATAVLPDGRVVAVTGSSDHAVRVWDLATGTPVWPLIGHTDSVCAVATAVLPDGRVVAVTGSSDRTVRVWDLPTGDPVGQPLTGHTASVCAVATAVLPDRRVVAVTGSSMDGTVRVWDLVAGTAVGQLTWRGYLIGARTVATAVLSDGRVVAVGGELNLLRVWDLATGTPVGQPLVEPGVSVDAVATAVLTDGRVVAVAGCGGGQVLVWDFVTGRQLAQSRFGFGAGALAVHQARAPEFVIGGAGLAVAELLW
ncbi:WD40 repeat domain-containing protein [Couchioplanes azureus]|uniref:WD40 repeat domain-containing protein n=1 Tax=Couchioplanes caeruleus TaxID=56438 RepID=UPI001670FF91|nr:WD40 repeat domain-containing protein [Couchioplanes caeruleus]